MDMQKRGRKRDGVLVVLCSLLALYGCGDDATGSDDEQTGTTFQGTVTVFDVPAVRSGPPDWHRSECLALPSR